MNLVLICVAPVSEHSSVPFPRNPCTLIVRTCILFVCSSCPKYRRAGFNRCGGVSRCFVSVAQGGVRLNTVLIQARVRSHTDYPKYQVRPRIHAPCERPVWCCFTVKHGVSIWLIGKSTYHLQTITSNSPTIIVARVFFRVP